MTACMMMHVDDDPDLEAEHRALLDDLLTWYPELPSLRLEPRYQRLSHVVHGWFMRCQRSVEAVLVLDDAELDDVAAPNRRCLFEHSVALRWVAAEGDVLVPVIRRHHQDQVGRLGKALQAAKWESVDMTDFNEIMAEIVVGNEAHDTYQHFAHQAEKYGTPHDVTTYVAETRQSHPGWESAAGYFDRDTQTMLIHPVRVLPQPNACVPSFLEALNAVNTMLKDYPWTEKLETAIESVKELDIAVRKAKGMTNPYDGDSAGDS